MREGKEPFSREFRGYLPIRLHAPNAVARAIAVTHFRLRWLHKHCKHCKHCNGGDSHPLYFCIGCCILLFASPFTVCCILLFCNPILLCVAYYYLQSHVAVYGLLLLFAILFKVGCWVGCRPPLKDSVCYHTYRILFRTMRRLVFMLTLQLTRLLGTYPGMSI